MTSSTDRVQFLGSKVAYQIYIRSFADSDGDGIGDLPGVTSKLDYLADLGIDYLWITPFFPSPQNDNGYDVADYCAIEPLFGTMADFEELAREARKRGIELMLDMVFNHTSDQHEWFQKALTGDPKYLAYYKFVDAAPDATAEDPGEPPCTWQSRFGGSAWEYVPGLNKWYLHIFDKSQPDLDWDNHEVRDELANVIRFWQGKGVSSFRFDVINLISKPDGWPSDDTDGRHFFSDGPHVHEYIRELCERTGIDEAMTVGEMNGHVATGPEAPSKLEHACRYTDPRSHELGMIFSFNHLKVDYVGGDYKWKIVEPSIAELRRIFALYQESLQEGGGWMALFWSNHDQPRPNSRLCDTQNFWYESSTLLPTCTFLMRGTPYIYQGEELGQTIVDYTSIDQYQDVESHNWYRILQEQGSTAEEAFATVHARSRDDGRYPMAWDGSEKGGFTTGDAWLKLPANHVSINAEAEMADPHSVRAYFKQLIALRHELEVIQSGTVRFVETASDKVIAYERELDGVRALVQCNFSGEEQPVLPAEGGELLVDNYEAPLVGTLRPWEAVAHIWRA